MLSAKLPLKERAPLAPSEGSWEYMGKRSAGQFPGTVKKILVESGTPVEFGEPLLILE